MVELFAYYFGSTPAGSIDPTNTNLTYGQLALINAEKIMSIASRFAAEGNQTMENLAHLKEDQIVGEWRDSTYGEDSSIKRMCRLSRITTTTETFNFMTMLRKTC